ncbi:TA system antitoxin ParD family protein [Arsukibacterium sp.]|uniref:TA system antitoxin ParD family protein n=1 Tax=Arsukibacterium sp. TaxID=1977258 RepID=UPI00299DBA34|nr:hypothetical protein [Arsukibacterium sp.]MDX1539282.1 hypothetical protein [Arsukibacterium sp.]
MTTASIRLEDTLVERAKIVGSAQSRSAAKQIEHWAKIGRMMEDNPDLSYEFVQQAMLAKAEKDAGQLEAYTFG